jgi:hypothetical protein
MSVPGSADNIAGRRVRLAALETTLAALHAQYDLAMSRFMFDEAREFGDCIEATERERNSLAEALPPVPAPPASEPNRVLPGRRRRR